MGDKASATVVASFNPIPANSISAIYVHLTSTLATSLPHNAGRRVVSNGTQRDKSSTAYRNKKVLYKGGRPTQHFGLSVEE